MLALRCRLLRDTFEGGQPDNPGAPEWPPSWMRIFSALVAVANHESDDEVGLLERLERLPPPTIYAAPLSDSLHPAMGTRRAAWVPQNKNEASRSATLVARENGERSWARFVPRATDVWYAWSDDPLEQSDREVLAGLCRRVPYVGRSTSPAILELAEVLPADMPSMSPWNPDASGAGVEGPVHVVRVPFPGALEALKAAYARMISKEPSDVSAIGKFVEYSLGSRETDVDSATGPYREVVVLGLDGPQRDGRHAVEFSDLLRKAVMARMTRQVPAVHGHGPRGTVQCAFLALPFVGHPYGDGHIVGLAVAIPELPPGDLRDLSMALGSVVERGLGSRQLGQFQLRRLSSIELRRAPLTLQPWRWLRESTDWVTVYPAVLDRYVKRAGELEELIRSSIKNSGYPEPLSVTASLRPFTSLVPGALDLQPGETVRPGHREGFRPYRHLFIRFPRPVRGPVVIGSMRHYGLGLCLPLTAEAVASWEGGRFGGA